MTGIACVRATLRRAFRSSSPFIPDMTTSAPMRSAASPAKHRASCSRDCLDLVLILDEQLWSVVHQQNASFASQWKFEGCLGIHLD